VGEFALDLTGPRTIGDLRLATGDEFLAIRDQEFVHHPSPYAEYPQHADDPIHQKAR
jgi:hypothetical protein